MKLAVFVDVAYLFAIFRNKITCSIDYFEAALLLAEDSRSRTVAEQYVGDDQAQIVGHLEGSAAYLDRDADDCTSVRLFHQGIGDLHVRDCPAAAGSQQIIETDISRQSQFCLL